ncbi:MAG: L,D-transpeptidase family protein [Oscillospiraceae bacterium]|nr:L,D-transpeptidase family protein [Oscillospiraceae bacterium]
MSVLCLAAVWMARAEPPKRLIVIDTQRMSLTLYENGKEIKRYPIAAGASGTPSPVGVFRVVGRFVPKAAGGFGTRFLRLSVPWGVYGIHGTNRPGSIGSHASHGCFRMFSKDAESLYALVPNGTPVIIEAGPYGELGSSLRQLSPGDRNAHVVAVQRKLRAMGYYTGNADGVYGPGTSAALRDFQADHGLPAVDHVDQRTYDALGIFLFE